MSYATYFSLLASHYMTQFQYVETCICILSCHLQFWRHPVSHISCELSCIFFIHQKNLHSCVLLEIIDLFQKVLVETEKTSSVHLKDDIDYHRELIHILDQLRSCVYKVSTFYFQNRY